VSIRRVSIRKSVVFALAQLLAKRLQAGRSYFEFLRVPAMNAGVYVLPAGPPIGSNRTTKMKSIT